MNNNNISGLTTYQAGALQSYVHRVLQKQSDQILKPYGISKMHWLIVGNVLDTGRKGITISNLSVNLGTTLSYLTTAINLLESKGFLVRKENTNDSRSKIVLINPEYLPLCKEIENKLRTELRDKIYSNVDPKEFKIYVKVLYQLKNIVKN